MEFLLTRNSDVKKKGGKFSRKNPLKNTPYTGTETPQGRDSASRSGGLVGDHLCAAGPHRAWRFQEFLADFSSRHTPAHRGPQGVGHLWKGSVYRRGAPRGAHPSRGVRILVPPAAANHIRRNLGRAPTAARHRCRGTATHSLGIRDCRRRISVRGIVASVALTGTSWVLLSPGFVSGLFSSARRELKPGGLGE